MYNRHRYCWQQSLNSKRLQMPRSFLVLFPPVSLALDSMLRPVPFPPPLSLYLGAQSVFGRGYEYPFFGEEGKICSEKERIAKIIRIESFRIFRLYRSIFSPERLKCTNTCIYIYIWDELFFPSYSVSLCCARIHLFGVIHAYITPGIRRFAGSGWDPGLALSQR